jgi:hypothetical protein
MVIAACFFAGEVQAVLCLLFCIVLLVAVCSDTADSCFAVFIARLKTTACCIHGC